jgi:hypothetical protein
MLTIIGLEVAIMRLMKVDQDGHHFTDRQGSFSAAIDSAGGE